MREGPATGERGRERLELDAGTAAVADVEVDVDAGREAGVTSEGDRDLIDRQ